MPTQNSTAKNWQPTARRLAVMLDEAITIPTIALKHHEWMVEAHSLIKLTGVKPGSSHAGGLYRRYKSADR